jgi:PAS domain S-box-containing protein
MLRILLLEDNQLDAELIQVNLTTGGVDCELLRVETRADFAGALEQNSFDLIFSEYSLPDFDGISALKIAATTCPEVPFIFVSACLGEELAIEALKSGATDYVLKQRLWRLVPSIKRALREAKERVELQQAESQLRKLAEELERRVEERTAQLAKVNQSLREQIAERQKVEESLRSSESTLRSYFELPLIGIAITSPDKEWIEVNDKLCEILGYNKDELTQMTWAELTYPEDLKADLKEFNQILAGTREGYSLDKRFIRKNGHVIYASISVRCVRKADGSVNYLVALVKDITERKHREERLRLLESVAVNANDAILITEAELIDESGPRIIYVNDAFTRMTGYTQQEVLGKTPRILQGPKTDFVELAKLRTALENWQPIVVELINYRKDGSEFWVEISIKPVANENGCYTHWVGVQRDITESKKALLALRLSDEVLKQMPDAVLLTDLEGNIQKWMGKAEEIFGYTASEAIGQPANFMQRPDIKAIASGRIIKKIQQTGTFCGEVTCVKKDGSQVPIETIATTVYDNQGNPIRFLGIHRDITERKRAQEESAQLIREQAARVEAEAQALKSNFLAEASTVLASSLDYETMLSGVVDLAVPYIADYCFVDILEEEQEIRRVAIAHLDPTKVKLLWDLNQRYPIKIDSSTELALALATGKSVLVNQISDSDLSAFATDEEHLQILRELNLKSVMLVPMVARGRTLGVMTFMTAESGRLYTQNNLAFVEDLAQRAALAVDNARLYRKATEAQQIAERTAERNASLQTITAALGEALTPAQVSEVVVNQGLDVLDADAGFIALFLDDKKTLELVSACGYPQEVLDKWGKFTLTDSLPITDAVRNKKPILLESLERRSDLYPNLITNHANRHQHNAWAAIPLIVEGRTLGGMGLSFVNPRSFSEEDLAFMQALAQQCAQAIERAAAGAAERKARADAEAANRTKDEFLATLSHELRTPLNAMMGWSQLLLTRKFDQEKILLGLETISRNTKSLATLIEDILDVSRIITGKLHIQPRACDLISVIEAAIEVVRPAAEAKAIQLECFFDVPLAQVWGDVNRLQQVIWNLLSNALKFTPHGGRVEVRLQMGGDGEVGGAGGELPITNYQLPITHSQSRYLQIQVSDTGKGIAPKFLPHVFERFRQENSGTTRSYGGLGLGLAIVRHLVELHGGTIQVASPGEGMGATFTVQLPILNPKLESNSKSSVEPTIISTLPAKDSWRKLEGLRILIVDDEADARELLFTILTESGAQVTVAASGYEALHLLWESRVDVLVSDIGMPNMDGYALIRKVRQLDAQQGNYIKAIALTAYARDLDRNLALEAGFQLHLTKPFEPHDLVSMVAKLVGNC